MIWVGYLVAIVFFYVSALLQNSFFTHFTWAGAGPNIIFSLFFILLFFGRKNNFYLFFLAVLAGVFLDIFLFTYFGTSIVALFIIGMFSKKTQISLKEGENNYSLVSFILIFSVALALYNLILQDSFRGIICSILCAVLLFFLVKKFKLEKFLK